jgi:hypothetical protein
LSNNEGLQAWLLHESVERPACDAARTRPREWLNAGWRPLVPENQNLLNPSKETRCHG